LFPLRLSKPEREGESEKPCNVFSEVGNGNSNKRTYLIREKGGKGKFTKAEKGKRL